MGKIRAISKKSILEQTKEYLIWLIKTKSEEETGDMLKLPSELDMANQMGVSRTTLRQALSELEAQGLIIRIHGKGTFINSHFAHLNQAYDPSVEYEALIKTNGYVPSARFLSQIETAASAEDASNLSISEGDKVVVLESVYYADGNPCIFNIDYIPASAFPSKYSKEEYLSSVFCFLEKHTGRITSRNHIVLYSAAQEECPKDKDGKPYLSSSSSIVAKSIFYDEKNEALFYSIGYYDTRYIKFHLINQSRNS